MSQHPLAVSAGQAGLQTDVAESCQGIGQRLDRELERLPELDLPGVRDLARRCCCANRGAGARAIAWECAAVHRCAQHERELIAQGGNVELPEINEDSTTLIETPSVGERRNRERPYFERVGGRRHR